jgi:hypothetical protein
MACELSFALRCNCGLGSLGVLTSCRCRNAPWWSAVT